MFFTPVRRNFNQIRNIMRKVVHTILLTGLITYLLTAAFVVCATDVDYGKVYKKQCATCHGNKGDGKGRAGASFASPPTNFTSPESLQHLSVEKIISAIRDGVAGTSMVAYGRRVDEETLAGLADFIQTTFMGRNASLAGNVELSVRGELKGEDNLAAGIDTDPGQLIYVDNCSACHGDKGKSAVWAQNGLVPPPRNFTTAQAKMELSRERMINSVTNGRPGTAMMSFAKRLSENDIVLVVDFIRNNFFQKNTSVGLPMGMISSKVEDLPSLQHGVITPAQTANLSTAKNSQPHAFSVDMLAGFPGELKGNAEKGKLFYNANCFTCHGKDGDGKGPRSHFNYPQPRNFTTDDSRMIFNRPRLFSAISRGKRGSVMPAWQTVLSKQQIADVAEYVYQQFVIDTTNGHEISLKKK